jgi:hypothetical protein
MQHTDEAPRLIDAIHHGGLADLETDAARCDLTVIQAIDHELQETLIGKRLTGKIDAAAPVIGQTDGTMGQGRQCCLHDPAINA